ncbi:MAG: AmmeMemoRadiSam system protein B [Thermoplasmata archaeon]|nr:AmmeMemoRadiSam system protein B [Thermoplasmata archaeon]
MALREPAVAGAFYPASASSLRKMIDQCFLHKLGYGRIPKLNEPGHRKIVGIVAPHAGYVYSGPIASHAYGALAEDGFPDTFIILGVNHHGFGEDVALTTQDFLTPLGTAKIDMDLAKKLIAAGVPDDRRAHEEEHSIEVHLPFLQYFKPEIQFVPIAMYRMDLATAKRTGEAIKKVIATANKDVGLIASTDFSHYVPREWAYKYDALAIEKIINCEPEGLYSTIRKYGISMCGYGPVLTLLHALGLKGKLLKYATSGDVEEMFEVVGYGSIVFEKGD